MAEEPGARGAEPPRTADGTVITDVSTDRAPRRAGGPEAATLVEPGGRGGAVALPAPGYVLGTRIGQGGMGEVLVAQDLRIGREVAVKRLRNTSPDDEQIARFLREARIQARLAHPAIVPVYELGVDEAGRPFFTMKRLDGKTLGQRQRDGMPLNRLLRAYVEVCLAIEYAHARGIVHRDLKPSNIMLGEYGEVYVIDWGIARVLADDQEPELRQVDIQTLDDGTKTGLLIGTPGYMAPEQVLGHGATPAADVYALGSILFELLAGEPLHPHGEAGLASALTSPQVSPAARRPDRGIPPELDAVCFRALAEDPRKRPTAHELAEQLQAFLDGDRDIARRREIAAEQLASARQAMASGAPDARAAAMRRAGRALALDPQSEDAAALVSALLLEPPPALPPELAAGLDDQERQISRDRARKAVWVYLSMLGLLPLALVVNITNWGWVLGFYSMIGLAALSAARSAQTGRPAIAVILIANLGLTVLFTRIAGPFVLAPLLVCATLAAITSIPWIHQRGWLIVGWTVTAVMLPIALEWAAVLPRTWQIGDDVMVITSDIVRSHGRTTELALVFASLLCMIVLALFMLALARRRRQAQQQLYIQAWHLRQLLPSAKRPMGSRLR